MGAFNSVVMSIRFQLTLFATGPVAERIEEVRRTLDPVQFRLIPAHVTLCREDEIEGLSPSVLQSRLETSCAVPICLEFGQPESFGTHGILLPCISGEEAFQALRQSVLGPAAVRRHSPHLTLAHPRNPKAAGNSLAAASVLGHGLTVRFDSVCRIRQVGADPWQVLERFRLPVTKVVDA